MNKPEEIYVLNKRVKLRHPAGGFRTSLDSVMLAAACPAKEGQNILDLGCGVGGAGLCVLTRVPDATLTGIDIQEDLISLAIQNAKANSLTPRTEFLLSSVLDYEKLNKEGNGMPFEHVICNPPYQESGERLSSPSTAKETAHAHQEDVNLQDWVNCAVRNLKSKGSLTVIHRADMIDKIIKALDNSKGENRFGGTEIIPLWPKQGVPAKRVIIRTYRDSRAPAIIHPGIVLHNENGDYTEEAEGILRGSLPIIVIPIKNMTHAKGTVTLATGNFSG